MRIMEDMHGYPIPFYKIAPIGLTSAQPYHYLNTVRESADKTWGVCMKELKGLNPDAEIVIGPAPVGPDGEEQRDGITIM